MRNVDSVEQPQSCLLCAHMAITLHRSVQFICLPVVIVMFIN